MDTSYIDWDAELSNTRHHIEVDPDAKSALDLLVQKGCSEFLILQSAFLYCGGEPEAIQSIKREFRRQRIGMVAVSKQLLGVANRIDTVVHPAKTGHLSSVRSGPPHRRQHGQETTR